MATQLQGADLRAAKLQGAFLVKAWLQGADLGGAQLQGADLSGARLWQASFAPYTDLGLSDLREADFTTRLTDDEIKVLNAALNASLEPTLKRVVTDASAEARLRADLEKRLGRLLSADQSADQPRFMASSERQVLVSDPKNPFFTQIPADWLITSPTPAYTSALVAFFDAELASDPNIANGIASRAAFEIAVTKTEDWRRSRYIAVACRLLTNGEAEKLKIEQGYIDRLSRALTDKKIQCEPAKPAAPH